MRSVLDTSAVHGKPKSILHLINAGESLPESPASQTRTVDLRHYQYQDHLKQPIVVGGGNIVDEQQTKKSDRVVVFKRM